MTDYGVEVRLGPEDEYMHPGPEPTFNESMYFNVYDPDSDVGGFVRIGNRPNEGHAEVTTCIYLPDGRVAFMFSRPEITDNERFDAGGARFEVNEPFESLRVEYSGKVVMLEEPLDMADPRAAFTSNPYEHATVALDYEGAATPFGGEPVGRSERAGEEFAKGHYEQLVKAKGTIAVGDLEFQVDGRGLRDHSWGPRTWQAPWYYRWLTVNMRDGSGMMLSRIARKDSDGSRNGFVWTGSELLLVKTMSLSTRWSGEDRYHATVHATFSTEHSDGRHIERELTGEVMNLIPLRNRREGRTTRISEGLTRWTLSSPLDPDRTTDGSDAPDPALLGYGLSEYLDQIIDDAPVGIRE
ncbi:MAG: hypothetical protein ACK5O2_00270 [Microthrixaceae bacterium]